MLEHCTISPPLGAAANLMIAQQHVARGATLKAKERFASALLASTIAESRRNAETGEGFDKTSMHRLIKFIASGRQRVAAGQNDAVSQFVVVQDRAAAREPPHGCAVSARRVLIAVCISLKVSQGERRLAPGIKPKAGRGQFLGAVEEHLVHRHVPRAVGGYVYQNAAAG